MQDIVLAVVLLICSFTDIVKRKIYNIIVYPALVYAFVINFTNGGWRGLGLSVLGLVVGLLILVWPFAKGGMGAGDVKLLGFVGALKGVEFVLYTALGMGLAGGAMALGIWIYRIGLVGTIKGLFKGIWTMISSGFTILPFRLGKENTTLPYGLAIALGTAGAWWWMR